MKKSPRQPDALRRAKRSALYPALFGLVAIAIACGGDDETATPAGVPVAEGVTLVAEWGSEGTGDGRFQFLTGIALDASGNVYVGDTNNNRVQVFSPEGRFLRKLGS